MNRQIANQTQQKSQTATPVSGSILQRKCACGNHTMGSGECSECSKKKGLGLQTKLTVNEPGDIYEREADRIADQVMATPAHPAVSGAPPRIQRFSGQSNGQMESAPASVDQALASPGRPLEPALRQDMEQRFGHDFSRVRVHTGAAADQSARDVSANAYTIGNNIVFGAGWFAPGTHQGRRLIAHELTHVVQQSGPDGIHLDQSDEKRSLSPIPPPFSIQQPGDGLVGLAPVSNTAVQRQPATVSKYAAQSALLDWKEKADAFLDGTRGWMAANWITYLGLTSSNPSLGWQETFIYSVASNAFGNAVNDAAKVAFNRILKKGAVKAGAAAAGAAVGGAIGNVPGAVIGFLVGVLIESIAGLIFDAISGKKELDEVAAKASRTTAQLIESKTSGFEKQSEGAKRELQIDFRIKQSGLTSTSSQAEVDALQKWAEEETKLIKDPPRLDDRSLYAEMIREWILEHAGDQDDPSKATSSAQWQFALKAAKTPIAINEERQEMKLPALPEALPADEDLNNHPEIFAYQTRRHWIDVGLPLQDEAQEMIDKVPSVAYPSRFVSNPLAFKGRVGDPDANVKNSFDGKKFTVNKTRQPQLLIRLMNKEDTDFVLVEEQKQLIEGNQFYLECQLDLAKAGGSVYVNNWNYIVTFVGPLPAHTCVVDFRSGKEQCGRPERETSFGVSPD